MYGRRKYGGFLLLIFCLILQPSFVYAGDKKVSAIQVPASSIRILEGSSKRLPYAVFPTDAKNPRVTFASSDRKIVAVDSKGVVSGVSVGKARILIRSTDGSNVSHTIEVLVAKKPVAVKQIAHRGLVTQGPENSVAAFEAAGQSGFWGVEFDIRRTKDNQFAVMHDARIDRTTNGEGLVKEYPFWKLRKYSLNKAKTEISKQKIPNLTEALQICMKYQMVPIIECKDRDISQVNPLLEELKRYDLISHCVIISEYQELLLAFRAKEPDIKLQWIERNLSPAHISWCAKNSIDLASKYKAATKKKITEAQQQKLLVNLWTIDNQKLYNKVLGYGANFLTLDFRPKD